MSNSLFLRIGKSRHKIQNGVFYCLRMCNQEASRTSSSGQNNDQSDSTYGAPEYFQYNEYSFNDIHAEMDKYRLPRPSSKTKNEGNK